MSYNIVKALGLLSGGLDSIIAIKIILQQNIKVTAISFITPFFNSIKAKIVTDKLNIPLIIQDITKPHMTMLEKPKYGFGKNMNPCIDCHAMMLKFAGQTMHKLGMDFIFTGEVLGQRPMSQNKNSLEIVARNSGYSNYILRPLSAKLLSKTTPELTGKVDRNLLYNISGRSRKKQFELVKIFNLENFFSYSPAGGCLLTNIEYSRKLKDLFLRKNYTIKDVNLLKYGRHFRYNNIKIISGRNKIENDILKSLSDENDLILTTYDIPGSLVMVPYFFIKNRIIDQNKILKIAAAICVRYSSISVKNQNFRLRYLDKGKQIIFNAISPDDISIFKKFLI